MRLQIETLADNSPQEFLHLHDQGIQIDHLWLEDLFAAEGQELPGERGGLFAGFANEIGVLLGERVAGLARRDQLRVTDDGREKIVEIMRHAAGEPADRFHFLRVPQFFFALAQRLLGRAPLLHFADEIVALFEEFLGRARQLAKLGVVSTHALDRFRIVPLQALHDLPERPADPADERGVDQEQKHEREKEKRDDQPRARAV